MKRRSALKHTALLTACGFSAGTIATFVSSCSGAALPEGLYLSAQQLNLLGLVVDTFLPKTETPSATEAGVHTFLDQALNSAMTEEEKETFMKSLEVVQNQSRTKYNKDFEKLNSEEREAVLLSLQDIENYFELLQGATLYVYYTSEKGAKDALVYDPVPGRYIGCLPYEEVGKAWAL